MNQKDYDAWDGVERRLCKERRHEERRKCLQDGDWVERRHSDRREWKRRKGDREEWRGFTREAP